MTDGLLGFPLAPTRSFSQYRSLIILIFMSYPFLPSLLFLPFLPFFLFPSFPYSWGQFHARGKVWYDFVNLFGFFTLFLTTLLLILWCDNGGRLVGWVVGLSGSEV